MATKMSNGYAIEDAAEALRPVLEEHRRYAAEMAIREMVDILKRHGDSFSGGVGAATDTAQDWIDHGFDAAAADDWCQVGCWDAGTAAELRDAWVTPSQAEAADNSLIELADGDLDEFCGSSPIYAACNGDISVQVLIAVHA